MELPQVPEFAPWLLAKSMGARTATLEVAILDRLSATSPQITREIAGEGLSLWGSRSVPSNLLRQAARWIDREPSLSEICLQVIEDIHLLHAEAGFDVSHSQPRWRRKIFVSVPERNDVVGALRIAESIIHEAMHLNLTNAEDEEALVSDLSGVMKSPWKVESRPYQGILHGLFVFACLSQYFKNMLNLVAMDEAAQTHCVGRVVDIADEIGSIDMDSLRDGLTGKGANLAQAWFRLGRAGLSRDKSGLAKGRSGRA